MQYSNERPTWDETYLEIAKVISKRSKDPRTKVGSVLVKNGCVIGIGYNGEPRRFTGHFNWFTEEKYNYVIHSEMNAISNACSQGINITNSILYVTLSPCHDCMKLIIQNQIKKVYYLEEYKDFELSSKIAKECGIELIKFRKEN